MNDPTIDHSSGTVLRGMLTSDCFPAPAAGYRHYGTGAYTPDGYGDYWSSSPTLSGDHGAGYLAFNSGNVKPLNSNQRACGFTVRCVQASAGCFLMTRSRAQIHSGAMLARTFKQNATRAT